MATAARQGGLAVAIGMLLLAAGAGVAVGLNGVELDLPETRNDDGLMRLWVARVLLLLALAWVVIGMFAARTRLVRRPGAAAARASWLASSRPWRARESTLGMLPLDRWLMILVPGALLVATRAVQSSFLGWMNGAIVLAAWLVFAAVVRALLWRRSPWTVIAAVGGVVVVRCILVLLTLAFSTDAWAFWADPVRRGAYVTVAVALFLWTFVAAGWSLVVQLGVRRAAGAVLAAMGAALAVPALAVGTVGVEATLTAWNDEIGLLPWELSRALSSAVHPDIPWIAAVFGAVLTAVGLVLALVRPRSAARAL